MPTTTQLVQLVAGLGLAFGVSLIMVIRKIRARRSVYQTCDTLKQHPGRKDPFVFITSGMGFAMAYEEATKELFFWIFIVLVSGILFAIMALGLAAQLLG